MPPTRQRCTRSKKRDDDIRIIVNQDNHIAEAQASNSPPRKKLGRPKTKCHPEVKDEDLSNGITSFSCQWIVTPRSPNGTQSTPHVCGAKVEVSDIPKHLRKVHGRGASGPTAKKDGKSSVKSKVTCRWAGCQEEMNADGVARHIRNCHLQTGMRTCLWCGRYERENEYYKRHGGASSCTQRQRVLSVLVRGGEDIFLKTVEELCARGGSMKYIGEVVRLYLSDKIDTAARERSETIPCGELPSDSFLPPLDRIVHFWDRYGVDLLPAHVADRIFRRPQAAIPTAVPTPAEVPTAIPSPTESSTSSPGPLAYDTGSPDSDGPATPPFFPAAPLLPQPYAPWSAPGSSTCANQPQFGAPLHFPPPYCVPSGPQYIPADPIIPPSYDDAPFLWAMHEAPPTSEGGVFGHILPETQPAAQPFDWDSLQSGLGYAPTYGIPG